MARWKLTHKQALPCAAFIAESGMSAVPSTPSKTKPSVLNLPTVLDMTAVMWQTRRVPKGGKEYENRDIHGSATVYMDDYFVLEPYSGVLKVTAKIKSEPWYSFFTVDKVRTSKLGAGQNVIFFTSKSSGLDSLRLLCVLHVDSFLATSHCSMATQCELTS